MSQPSNCHDEFGIKFEGRKEMIEFTWLNKKKSSTRQKNETFKFLPVFMLNEHNILLLAWTMWAQHEWVASYLNPNLPPSLSHSLTSTSLPCTFSSLPLISLLLLLKN